MKKLATEQLKPYIEAFKTAHPEFAETKIASFAFGNTPEMADRLGNLVVQGIKTGTCDCLELYQHGLEPLPQKGQIDLVLDGQGAPLCIIQNINLTILPFREVTDELAFKEGEGDRSLNYWRKAHWEYFTPIFQTELQQAFTEETLLVYEEFQVIYR